MARVGFVVLLLVYHVGISSVNGLKQPTLMVSQSCDPGVIKVEQFQYNPTDVPSPGYVYYSLKASVPDSETAMCLARGDLQMTFELLSPTHGVVPMPCIYGVGSCTKSVRDYAPDLARMLSEGQTEILIDNKAICLFDAAAMGELYSSGEYRVTGKFLEEYSHKTLACLRFETTVVHGQDQCSKYTVGNTA